MRRPARDPRQPDARRVVVVSATDDALAALERMIYLLDRTLAPSSKVRAYSHAVEVVTELAPGELESRVEHGTLQELAGIGPSTGSVIAAAVKGEVPAKLAELERTSVLPLTDEGRAYREALRGDCHAHSTWSDGGASDRGRWPAPRPALGHDYLVMTDHSPRLTVAHGLEPRAARGPARRDRAAQRRAGPVPRAHRHRGRHPRGRRPRRPGRHARPPRHRRRQRALQALDGRRGHDPPHGAGRRQPPRRHPRAHDRAQAPGPGADARRHARGRPGRVPVRRRAGVRRLRPLRHRGRDQLPARAPGPARRPARPRPRLGLPGRRSTPTPTPPASSNGRSTGATRPPATTSSSTGSSTPWAPTSWSNGPARTRPGSIAALCRRRPRSVAPTPSARPPTTAASPTRVAELRTPPSSPHSPGRHRRGAPRAERRRPVPLARGRRRSGGPGVDRGAERPHRLPPRAPSRPRGAAGAPARPPEGRHLGGAPGRRQPGLHPRALG